MRAGGCPEGFALVAVKGCPRARTSPVATGSLEILTPIPPEEFKSGRETSFRAGNTKVNGPGQKLAINFSASAGTSATSAVEHLAVGDEYGNGVVGVATFESKDLFHGGDVKRVGAQAVEGFGGIDDDLTAS